MAVKQAGTFMRTGARGSPSWPRRKLMGRIHCSRLPATNWNQSACRTGAGHTFGSDRQGSTDPASASSASRNAGWLSPKRDDWRTYRTSDDDWRWRRPPHAAGLQVDGHPVLAAPVSEFRSLGSPGLPPQAAARFRSRLTSRSANGAAEAGFCPVINAPSWTTLTSQLRFAPTRWEGQLRRNANAG
jgi:hypothetical protein